ncbi:MAG TPA: hypothetical protein VFQ61_36130 [Polyangiaceae bacterium]|nr:hypothetical protein [Polyangiaceae bacterium]
MVAISITSRSISQRRVQQRAQVLIHERNCSHLVLMEPASLSGTQPELVGATLYRREGPTLVLSTEGRRAAVGEAAGKTLMAAPADSGD